MGVGIVNDALPQHGLLHPEMGHVFVPLHPDDAHFAGVCPFHGSCVEGMVASRAIAQRLGMERTELDQIPDDHAVWPVIAHYLAHLCSNLVLTVSPHRIILGGGIMQREGLLPSVRRLCLRNLAGYIQAPPFASEEAIAEYITVSPFGNDAGLIGAAVLSLR